MRNQAVFKLIKNQLSSNPLKRRNANIIQQELHKNHHQLNNFQLLCLYRQISRVSQKQRVHSKSMQSIKNSKFINQNNQHSYQKRVFSYLEEIHFKGIQKNGVQNIQVDLAGLYYYRLINAIKFKLPFQHIIEPFKQNFYPNDFGVSILYYLSILTLPCSTNNSQIQQVASFILTILKQQLPNINAKQYTYVKFIIQNSQYFVEQDIGNLLEKLIDQNIEVYNYAELSKFMTFKNKSQNIIRRHAFIQKHQVNQKVAYLYLNKRQNQKKLQNKQQNKRQNEKTNADSQYFLLPGNNLNQNNITKAYQYYKRFYKWQGDINLFQNIISSQDQTLPNLNILKHFVDYQFSTICVSIRCPQNESLVTIKNLKTFLTVAQKTIQIKRLSSSEDQTKQELKKHQISILQLKNIILFYQEIVSGIQSKNLQTGNLKKAIQSYNRLMILLKECTKQTSIEKINIAQLNLQKFIQDQFYTNKKFLYSGQQFYCQLKKYTDMNSSQLEQEINRQSFSSSQTEVMTIIALYKLLKNQIVGQSQVQQFTKLFRKWCNTNEIRQSEKINKVLEIIQKQIKNEKLSF